jgi:ferrous iron transport protein A
MSDTIPITALGRGEVAEIALVVGAPDLIRRFAELGLRSGTRLQIVRAGSPCIVRMAGTTLCVREDESIRVLVKVRKTA